MDNSIMPSSPRHARPPTRSDNNTSTANANNDGVPSICRICRSEATETEPLFYPCKCSGSIKFVHQDCLMEWLSHSQKKYCELCKTSFRFTKLYSPDMPQTLPVHIFLEHMAKYLFRNLVVWFRALLAISVWICFLPLSMRAVWSFMFWISDEGLGGSISSLRGGQASWEASLYNSFFGQCTANPLLDTATTTLAQAATMMKNLPGDLSGIPKFAVKSVGYAANTINGTGSFRSFRDGNGTITIIYEIDSPSASLLSNVTFLRNLTQSPRVNRTIMSIIEGQMITILVVICFILIILVRDYVVQQQPELNMRAAFANQEEAAQGDAFDANPDQPVRDAAEDVAGFNPHHDPVQPHPPPPTPPEVHPSNILERPPVLLEVEQEAINKVWALIHHPGGLRTPDEETLQIMEYLDIYRRARGDYEEVIRIIERENTDNRLLHWAEATRQVVINDIQLMAERRENDFVNSGGRPDTPEPTFGLYHERLVGSDLFLSGDDEGPFRETDYPASPLFQDTGATSSSSGADLRPRAASAGPSHTSSRHPLANNNWTFEGLQSDEQGPSGSQHGSPDVSASTHADGSYHGPSLEDLPVDSYPNYPNQPIQGLAAEPGQGDDLEREPEAEPEAAVQMLAVDTAAPPPGAAAPINNDEPIGFVDRVANLMWGGLDHHADELELQVAEAQDDDEDAWVDVIDDDFGADDAQPAGDDPMQAADGFDEEAIDEMEDFEGVMELIGMRGPIAGLFQNAVFCSVLVSVTIFACIFVPYNIGRVTVWLLASPMRLVRMIVEISKLIQDALVMACAFLSWCVIHLVDLVLFSSFDDVAIMVSARKTCWALWINAGARIFDYLFMDFPMSATEIQNFSAISHVALLSLKAQAARSAGAIQQLGWTAYTNGVQMSLAEQLSLLATKAEAGLRFAIASSSLLLTPDAWVINLGESKIVEVVDPELARWSGADRFWAILAGYMAVFSMAAMYLQRNTPFSNGEFMRAWEAGVIDTLQQASGIMKVILIISIEMLVFPLYCGMLLDLALLPLFGDATVLSRLVFTRDYPATSVFVHWFVGTGYMFHFALFVSMCRKIMRPGVLYFIRDPDDPEFHPVRDVLERNLITQLRKILFSAFVYGALVIVCLGGVVWGLSWALPPVLPIHYSSNEPVLEFPVDLLFYNFLMPLAIKFFKPGDGIHTMYTWWFRRCARALRLTSFLFGTRKIDEEGSLRLAGSAGSGGLQSLFVRLGDSDTTSISSWKDAIVGDVGVDDANVSLIGRKEHLVRSRLLVEDGKFVRAPASDRVKIAKGRMVFLAVDENNKRQDGKNDDDLYASDQYRKVYVPPGFKSRIFCFIFFIWIFAAVTGVGLTIVPLVIGRAIFKMLIPDYVRTNDIYAFSIGIYIVGAVSYLGIRSHRVLDKVRGWVASTGQEMASGRISSRALSACVRVAQLVYTYFFLAIVLPLLIAVLIELYIAIPLHTYMNPPTAATVEADKAAHSSQGRHTVRLTQSWTLGLLFMKLGSQTITTLFPTSRAAVAVRSVLRRGWQRPDVGVFTRAFVIPGLAIALVAIFVPPLVARSLVHYQFAGYMAKAGGTGEEMAKLVIFYRFSYPCAAVLLVVVKNGMMLASLFNKWTSGVRDEAYLIGERLHNFGAATAGTRKGRATWKAGGNRL